MGVGEGERAVHGFLGGGRGGVGWVIWGGKEGLGGGRTERGFIHFQFNEFKLGINSGLFKPPTARGQCWK